MYTKLTDEIFKVSLPHHREGVNSYLVKGEHGYTVIDTGWYNDETKQVWENIVAGGIKFEKLVLTHTHPDHAGLALWFRQRYGVPILVSAPGYEMMKRRAEGTYPFMLKHDGPQISEKRYNDNRHFITFDPDELFHENEIIIMGDREYKPVWTPGHAPDQFCFWNEETKVAIVGDHMLKEFAPIVPKWREEDVNPLKDYFDSLGKVKNLPAELALTGHGEPITNVKARIEEIEEHHRERLRQIVKIVGDSGKTAGRVSREIYGSEGGEFQKLMELSTTVARLTYLVSEGTLKSRMQDGKMVFSGQ